MKSVCVHVSTSVREREEPHPFMHANLHFDPDEVVPHPLTHNPSAKQKHTHTHTLSQMSSEVGNTQSVSDTGESKEEIFALPDLLMKPGRDGEEIWSEKKNVGK